MFDINTTLKKFSDDVIKNIDIEEVNKIIIFLKKQNCDYCEELVEDYLDLFTFGIDEFKNKFNYLNEEYNNNFLELARYNMHLFEEFYKC